MLSDLCVPHWTHVVWCLGTGFAPQMRDLSADRAVMGLNGNNGGGDERGDQTA